MTNPVTPNIGLNKIDRTSPATTYFDLEKYIDQNADTVDRFAGEASQAIEALQQRLDTEERREVVLQPGLQIVNEERSAPFSLSGIKGRTLVNLLGRDGNCENVSRFTPWQATLAAETVNKTQGNQSLKITTTATPGGSGALTGFPVKEGSYYLIVAEVRLGSGTSIGAYLNGLAYSKGNTNSTDTTKFKTVWKAYSVSAAATVYAVGEVVGPSGSVGYVDAIRVYEISAIDYAALDGMTPEQIAAKYPYVDSLQPVRNPYVLRYGENLLPPFYEWARGSQTNVISPYALNLNAIEAFHITTCEVPFVIGQSYTLTATFSGDVGGYIHVRGYDSSGAINSLDITTSQSKIGINVLNYTVPEGTVSIVVIFTNTKVGVFNVSNPMLTLGSETKPFKPREDSMLAMQTDLYADPVNGANADEVFEKDGQYFKLAKWKGNALDGSLSYVVLNNYTGFKRVAVPVGQLPLPLTLQKYWATKYQGSLLSLIDTSTRVDAVDYSDTHGWLLSISNTDSGWGDNYTPTADEIKAYFIGWKMYDAAANASSVYNGSGGKAWVNLAKFVKGDHSEYTTTIPTVPAVEYTPYQLVYQLATPTVEPIVSEGMLTFNEGDNQIEVGTGIVVRESVKPVVWSNGYTWINGRTIPSYPLKNRPSKILTIYKNARQNTGWRYEPVDSGFQDIHGLVQARIENSLFDTSAAYSATYLMMDTSPIVPFTGSYAANEKMMLQELTDTVQQNATAVSVLMNKKADKDSAGWITPTLLNGAINVTGLPPVRIMKDSMGYVHIQGAIKPMNMSVSTVFKLPKGYRPGVLNVLIVAGLPTDSGDVYTRINIDPNGDVVFVPTNNPNHWVSFFNIPPFLAEQ
ncbi:hypothetical protein BBD41_19260 [Paenibacillus ihbetae]|uniref:Uncharacterized protein n=1 Tax=Paenibacillus ihbetae TaxID=1870820 RepID=A0A1B2E3G5_9BACL|nr:hypothetical protein [Paenibacillus ihbetae]ANY74536.1 hypothetical protein BBD41_19260 [Paenibacillus ihbetae]